MPDCSRPTRSVKTTEAPTRRVEIIHESLLANWPRLVRWQTQDADGAQLRDQLRQAARTWDEHGRTDDTLWTGTAYREFALWRERYPGGLSELEEAFATAMTSLATRRRRRRRIAVAAVHRRPAGRDCAVFGTLWRRSVLETRRAEAAKLLALAQVQLDTGPTEALAYATSSLELADTYEARILALRALSEMPPLSVLDLRQTSDAQFWVPTFSPDGRWLALAGVVNDKVLVYGERGGQPIVLGGHTVSASDSVTCAWSRDGLLVTGHWTEGRVRVWSMPKGSLVREIDLGGTGGWQVGDTHLLARIVETDIASEEKHFRLRSWKLPDGEPEELGVTTDRGIFDRDGRRFIYVSGDSVNSRPLPITAGVRDTMIARHSPGVVRVRFWRRPNGLYSEDSSGEIILWTTAEGTSAPGRRLRVPATDASVDLIPDPGGRWIIDDSLGPTVRRLWDLAGLPQANPPKLRRSAPGLFCYTDFDPRGNWVAGATAQGHEVAFWPLSASLPIVVEGWESSEFTADGRYLATPTGTGGRRGYPGTALAGAGE